MVHSNVTVNEVTDLLNDNVYNYYYNWIDDKEYLEKKVLELSIVGELKLYRKMDYREIVVANGVPQAVLVEVDEDKIFAFKDAYVHVAKGDIFTCMFCKENTFHFSGGEMNAIFLE